jgi:cell division protein FtsX
MNIKDIAQSKTLRGIIIGIVIVIFAIFIFQAGVFVGYRKADFSGRFGDNYSRAFGGNKIDIKGGFPQDIFVGGHGAVGKIVRINLPTLVVADRDNVEKVVIIDNETSVRKFRETSKITDLKAGDFVVILGSPDDDGQIRAKLIRIMPEKPMTLPTI